MMFLPIHIRYHHIPFSASQALYVSPWMQYFIFSQVLDLAIIIYLFLFLTHLTIEEVYKKQINKMKRLSY